MCSFACLLSKAERPIRYCCFLIWTIALRYNAWCTWQLMTSSLASILNFVHVRVTSVRKKKNLVLKEKGRVVSDFD